MASRSGSIDQWSDIDVDSFVTFLDNVKGYVKHKDDNSKREIKGYLTDENQQADILKLIKKIKNFLLARSETDSTSSAQSSSKEDTPRCHYYVQEIKQFVADSSTKEMQIDYSKTKVELEKLKMTHDKLNKKHDKVVRENLGAKEKLETYEKSYSELNIKHNTMVAENKNFLKANKKLRKKLDEMNQRFGGHVSGDSSINDDVPDANISNLVLESLCDLGRDLQLADIPPP